MKLTDEQQAILNRAQEICRANKTSEWDILVNVQEAHASKLYKALRKTLFQYTSESFDLDGGVAYSYMAVARKALEIPELADVLRSGRLRVNKANRIISTLNTENSTPLIEFACTHTSAEIENEVANRNPKATPRDQIKALGGGRFQVKTTFSQHALTLLDRVASLEAQCGRKNATKGETIESALEVYLNMKDPVRKAERANRRAEKEEPPVRQKPAAPKPLRQPLTAAQKHAVMTETQGRCTHVGADGKRCNSDRWIAIHHIQPISCGGSNDPENLTVLCSFHHDLVHQLSLPIDGQVTWRH